MIEFIVDRIEKDKSGKFKGFHSIFIRNNKQFLTYLKMKYNLPRNSWVNNEYIVAWMGEITVSPKYWELIKGDKYIRDVHIT